ncbi:MAG: hypothetical protein ACREFT_03205 [Acetobacteraceae bacterium]
MPARNSDLTAPSLQHRAALSTWETGSGVRPDDLRRGVPSEGAQPEIPPLTDAELVHLRIRVIALENMLISLLALAPDRQLDLTRELAAYIFPRSGFTQHPLTVRAAHQMVDLLERAGHFRATTPTPPTMAGEKPAAPNSATASSG